MGIAQIAFDKRNENKRYASNHKTSWQAFWPFSDPPKNLTTKKLLIYSGQRLYSPPQTGNSHIHGPFLKKGLPLGKGAENQNGNLRWHLPLGVRPPPLMAKFQDIFYPTFFLLQLNPTYMKRILHFQNITFKSSYNWFKIDIHQQLRPLTANYLAMFKVISTTIYT